MRLAQLRAAGFDVPAQLDVGPDEWGCWSFVYEYLDGPSARDVGSLDDAQIADMRSLVSRMLALGWYVGDLNPRNLIWARSRWWVIDCGHIRRGLARDEVLTRLRRKWNGRNLSAAL